MKSVSSTGISRKSIIACSPAFPKSTVESSLEFSDLKLEYISLLDLARDVTRQNYGDFFRPLGSPGVNGRLLPKRSVLIVAAAFTLGAFLATLIVLVLPSKRKEA